MTDSDPETMLAIVLIAISLVPIVAVLVWGWTVLT